jgi:hypothetical protein
MSRLWRGWFESSYSALVGKCCWRDPASPDNNYEFRLSGRCGRDMLDASSFYSGALPTSASAPLDGQISNSDICGSAGTIETPGALRARGVDVTMLTGDKASKVKELQA